MATVNEDRQAGSGFAMFSSVDFGGSRSLVIEATASGSPVTLDPPARFADQIESLITSPTNARAAELARALQVLDWSVEDGAATEDGDIKIIQVRIIVRGLTADGRTLESQVLAEGTGR